MKSFGSLSWVLVKICFDPEYEEMRARSLSQHPQNILQGLKQGFIDCAKSFWYGVSGAVLKPFQGGMEEGILGFAKGF